MDVEVDIRKELLRAHISEFAENILDDLEIDVNEIANTTAIKVLSEIQTVIKNHNSENSNIAEEIVQIFEKYKLDFGIYSDFG